jgi:hypothetical protein
MRFCQGPPFSYLESLVLGWPVQSAGYTRYLRPAERSELERFLALLHGRIRLCRSSLPNAVSNAREVRRSRVLPSRERSCGAPRRAPVCCLIQAAQRTRVCRAESLPFEGGGFGSGGEVDGSYDFTRAVDRSLLPGGNWNMECR